MSAQSKYALETVLSRFRPGFGVALACKSGFVFTALFLTLRALSASAAGPAFTPLDGLPLLFEAAPSAVGQPPQFTARTRSGRVVLTPCRASLILNSVEDTARGGRSSAGERIRGRHVHTRVVQFELVDANPSAVMTGAERSTAQVNYLVGAPSEWRAEVPAYDRVRVSGIYPGIDLVYYGNQRQFEYDFMIAPAADPGRINFRVFGADQVKIDGDGELVVRVGEDELRQHKPVLYQLVNGVRHEIPGGYRLKENQLIGFEVGPYDPNWPLIIDPVLSYATYLGRIGTDIAWDIALDSVGNIYIAGETLSANLPTTTGVFQPVYGGGYPNAGGDAFVAKFDNSGSHLQYLTYLGGNGDDAALALAVDLAGNAYLTGITDSTNFPVRGAVQPTIGGQGSVILGLHPFDAFVAKLNPAGSGLVFSTYLGGDDEDQGIGIAVDAQAAVYVAGFTFSTNFPAVHPLQPKIAGRSDTFVAKFRADGSRLLYSTYLGGADYDIAEAIAVDSAGRAFIAGLTRSVDFPVVNAVQPWAAGNKDAFVAGLGPAGTNLVFSTYLGGSEDDTAYRLTLDPSGQIYIVGTERSGNTFTSDNFPITPGPLFPGGVYVSVDAGLTWSESNAGLLHPEVLSLAVDPARNNYVYAGTSHGVAHSSNGGASWDPRIKARATATGVAPRIGVGHVLALATDPLSSGIVYAGTAEGVYKSSTFGSSWGWFSTNLHTTVLALAVDPQQSSNVYAGTVAGVYRSTNGAKSWFAINSGLGTSAANAYINQLAIDPSNPSILYAATDGGLFKSTNRGKLWFDSSIGITNLPVLDVVLEPQSPQTLYARSVGPLYKSINGGTNWFSLSLGPTYTNVQVTALTVDPANTGTIYAGAHHTVLKSSDGGLTWTASTNGLARSYRNYVTHLLVSPGDPNVVYAGFTEAGYSTATDQGFLTVIDPVSGSIRLSTPIGFDGATEGWAVALDSAANPYVVGTTSARYFRTLGTSGLLSSTNNGGYDVFVTAFARDGSGYLYSVLLGGSSGDFGYGIALDPSGNAYITGETFSDNFPSLGAFQRSFGGLSDAFLAKIGVTPGLQVGLSGQAVQVRWRAFAPEYALETRLGDGLWTGISQVPLLTNGWHVVTLPPSEAAALFRLRHR